MPILSSSSSSPGITNTQCQHIPGGQHQAPGMVSGAHGCAGALWSWVTMSPVQLCPPSHPPSHLLERTEAPQQGDQCPSHSLHRPAASQTCTQLCVTTPGQGSHTGSSAAALSQQLHPAGEVATSPFVSVHTTDDEKHNLDFTRKQRVTPIPA